MSNEAMIEAAARVLALSRFGDANETSIAEVRPDARAVAPILLEAGAKMMQDAAAKMAGLRMTKLDIDGRDEASDEIYQVQCGIYNLDPAAIVKEAND